MAYQIVYESEYKRYRSECSAILKKTCAILMKKGISTQFTLVGSGARNLVTRNGCGPFDLDYNLEIIKAEKQYWSNLELLKNTVRTSLNEAVGSRRFSDAQDSTSCLTALLHFPDSPQVEFSVDVAIVKREDGRYSRLIHNKNAFPYGQEWYTWNEVPNSHDVQEKADRLKKENRWLEVRNRYVYLKNLYLSRGDKNHPSFVVYVEAVNEIYGKYFGRYGFYGRAFL